MRPCLGLSSLAAGILVLLAADAGAERLPVRRYTTADGLAGGPIHQIVRDSKGFLWFCTDEGVSRFDGVTFARFGVAEGLPSSVVTDLLETRDGTFWLATGKGLCRLDPPRAGAGGPALSTTVFRVPGERSLARRLLEDSSGTLWCGTMDGLVRVDRSSGGVELHPVDLGLPHDLWDDAIVGSLAEGPDRELWVGTGSGLYRLGRDGRVERYTSADGLPHDQVRAVAVTPDGSVWTATRNGVGRLYPEREGGRRRTSRIYSPADGLKGSDVSSLHVASGKGLWVGTDTGVSFLDGDKFTNYGRAEGIPGSVYSLEEDANGDLWMGTEGAVQRLSRRGLVTFGEEDGLGSEVVDRILEDQRGHLCVARSTQRTELLSVLKGSRFDSFELRSPPGVSNPGWGWNQSILQDHTGEWWLPTGQGLCRYARTPDASRLAGALPRRVYTTADGLAVNDVFVLFEESRGDVWFSMASPVTNGLARWRRSEDRIESFHESDGLPQLRTALATAFAEDRAGNVWVAFNGAGLARFRDGRFDLLSREDGVPEGWILALLVDRIGRLWIAASLGGVGVVADPGASRPGVRRITVADGLASNSARCLAEDAWGRIYVGNGAGVDRIDEASGIHHFTEAVGLAGGSLRTAYRDRSGAIWFGTTRGLSRHLPAEPEKPRPPSIFVTGLRLSGILQPLPVAGLSSVELPDLPFDRNRVQIDFVSPGVREGDATRYQYRLEDKGHWGPPGTERTVDLASLSPGRYRFEVRAVAPDGTIGRKPAIVLFAVLAPFWRRGWFLALVVAALGAAVWAASRYRLGHLLELERVRTRIAADLHDDIGSGLSRIAILSEVVKRQVPAGKAETSRFLGEIADTSRQLVDAMSDIVWSIDSRRDDLTSLLARVGQFAATALEAQGIRWIFEVPSDPGHVKLTPEQRRGTYLILKEAINNAMKHADCRTLALRVRHEDGLLTTDVCDDGRGLPAESGPASGRRGRGLLNMKARAREIGGRLTIVSAPDSGTFVRLELPTGGEKL